MMFPIKLHPFISLIEEGEGGGGEEQQQSELDDFGVPIDFGQQQETQETEVKLNPAWNEVLSELPEELHAKVMPKLKGWDDNFAKVQSDYAPYKAFLEQKIPAEALQQAYQLAELVSVNPKAVYDELAKRFGFGQGQQQVEEEEEEEENPQIDFTKNPVFKQMQETISKLEQETNAKAQREADEAETRRIESEFENMEKDLKVKLSPDVRAEILRRTVFIGDATGTYNLLDGYNDYANFVSKIRNSTANNTAPRVLSGNGSMPVETKQFGQLTSDEERQEFIANAMQSLLKKSQ